MTRFWKASAIALLTLVTLAPAAEARGGRGFVRPYRFYSAPLYYYPGFYYGSWWYYPWYGPYWGLDYGYVPRRATGDVKIETKQKGNAIYVDGGYAGETGKLKKFPLRPGTHTIEVRDAQGRRLYQERVYVIAGKTVKVRPDLPG